MSFPDISKVVSAKWRNMSKEEKEEYVTMSKEDAFRYESEMANFKERQTSEDMQENDASKSTADMETAKTSAKKKKKNKDPNKPKKYRSAYIFFSHEMYTKIKSDNPELTFKEVGKELGKKYKELTAEEKEKYVDMQEQDKVRYESEMEIYNSGGKVVEATNSEASEGSQDKEVTDDVEETVPPNSKEEEEEEEAGHKLEDSTSIDEKEGKAVKTEIDLPTLEDTGESDPVDEVDSTSPVRTRKSKRKNEEDKTPHDKKTKVRKQSTKKKRKKKGKNAS